MRSLWPKLAAWLDGGQPFALATVAAVSGSAPRAPGSCMAIMPERSRFLGSVSSGCLDVEIVEAARTALATGKVQRLRFGPDGRPPWTDGLTCGGWIEVRVEPWWSVHPRSEVHAVGTCVRTWLAEDQPGVVLSDAEHHLAINGDGSMRGDRAAFGVELTARALAHLREELPPMEWEEPSGPVFVRTVRRRARLFLVGAVDVAARLVAFAGEAGFATTVVEPRTPYLADERLSRQPDRTIRGWPQAAIAETDLGPRDMALVLTHDPKIDDAALLALLQTRVGYLGALGSSRSHAARCERLRAAGVDEAALQRIQGPAGLHLGAPDATGIAAGIFAGIVQWQAQAERARAESARSVSGV